MTDKSQSPKAGDEEPNLHEMRKHVDAALLEIFQDWAFRQAQTWPHGQYSPHDFTPFFEKGALFGFAHARQSPDSRGNLINRNESNKDIPETKASAPQVEAQAEKWPPIGYRQRLKSCKQRFDEKWQFDQKSGSGIGSAQETQVDMGCSILKEKRTEHTAALSAARAEGWNEAVKQFRIHGTDGCRTCATGRVTLFIANDQCTQCNPKSYERKAIAAPPEGQATEGEGT